MSLQGALFDMFQKILFQKKLGIFRFPACSHLLFGGCRVFSPLAAPEILSGDMSAFARSSARRATKTAAGDGGSKTTKGTTQRRGKGKREKSISAAKLDGKESKADSENNVESETSDYVNCYPYHSLSQAPLSQLSQFSDVVLPSPRSQLAQASSESHNNLGSCISPGNNNNTINNTNVGNGNATGCGLSLKASSQQHLASTSASVNNVSSTSSNSKDATNMTSARRGGVAQDHYTRQQQHGFKYRGNAQQDSRTFSSSVRGSSSGGGGQRLLTTLMLNKDRIRRSHEKMHKAKIMGGGFERHFMGDLSGSDCLIRGSARGSGSIAAENTAISGVGGGGGQVDRIYIEGRPHQTLNSPARVNNQQTHGLGNQFPPENNPNGGAGNADPSYQLQQHRVLSQQSNFAYVDQQQYTQPHLQQHQQQQEQQQQQQRQFIWSQKSPMRHLSQGNNSVPPGGSLPSPPVKTQIAYQQNVPSHRFSSPPAVNPNQNPVTHNLPETTNNNHHGHLHHQPQQQHQEQQKYQQQQRHQQHSVLQPENADLPLLPPDDATQSTIMNTIEQLVVEQQLTRDTLSTLISTCEALNEKLVKNLQSDAVENRLQSLEDSSKSNEEVGNRILKAIEDVNRVDNTEAIEGIRRALNQHVEELASQSKHRQPVVSREVGTQVSASEMGEHKEQEVVPSSTTLNEGFVPETQMQEDTANDDDFKSVLRSIESDAQKARKQKSRGGFKQLEEVFATSKSSRRGKENEDDNIDDWTFSLKSGASSSRSATGSSMRKKKRRMGVFK